jgi:hypothetical protein
MGFISIDGREHDTGAASAREGGRPLSPLDCGAAAGMIVLFAPALARPSVDAATAILEG